MNNGAIESAPVPEAPEAECAIITALVSPVDGKNAADVVFKAIEPRYFHDTGRQRIFSTMLEIHQDGGVVDKTTVSDILRRRGLLESVGGPEAMPANSNLIADEANLEQWIKAVHEAWASREVQRLGNEMLRPATPRPAIEVLAEAKGRLTGIENVLKGRRRRRWVWQAQGQIFEAPPPPPAWDVEGLLPADDAPVLLYGDPKTFKSFIGLHIAACMATGDPVFGHFKVPVVRTPTMFLNFDAGSKALARRAYKLGKKIDTLLTSSPDAYDPVEFEATIEELRGAWIVADCVSDMHVPEPGMEQGADTRKFYRTARTLYQRHNVGGMFIDHTNRSGAGVKSYYGSAQKHAALRNMWHVERIDNPPPSGYRVKLTCFKLSEDEEWPPFYVDIHFTERTFTLEFSGWSTDDRIDTKANEDFEAVARMLRIAPKSRTPAIVQATAIPEGRVRAVLSDRRIEAFGSLTSPTRCYSLRDEYDSDVP